MDRPLPFSFRNSFHFFTFHFIVIVIFHTAILLLISWFQLFLFLFISMLVILCFSLLLSLFLSVLLFLVLLSSIIIIFEALKHPNRLANSKLTYLTQLRRGKSRRSSVRRCRGRGCGGFRCRRGRSVDSAPKIENLIPHTQYRWGRTTKEPSQMRNCFSF